jgi:multidrug resistance efflux pump
MSKNECGCFSFTLWMMMLLVQEWAGSGEKIVAITRPSADVTLSFVQPGRIAKVNIKEGESVEAGKASPVQKRLGLQKLETAAARNAATQLEVEHAKLDVKIAELSLAVAIFEQQQAIRKHDEARLQIDNMSLRSLIGGSTEKIEVETGESVNALEGVVQVIQIDPLWIEVPAPPNSASILTHHDPAEVRFPGPDKISSDAKMTFIAAVSDAESGTLRA